MWDIHTLTLAMGRVLEVHEAHLRLEQAVYGLDSMEELPLQSLMSAGLAGDYEVAREVHYPSSLGVKNRAARARCDLVLSPKGYPLAAPAAPTPAEPPTLFSAFEPPPSPRHETPADKALWVEVKVARQFRSLDVVHGGYGSQWRQALVGDLKKMEADPLIAHAALALVVFTENQQVLDRDLQGMEDVLVRQEVLAGFRKVASVPITDRMGHRLASVAVWPTIQRGMEAV